MCALFVNGESLVDTFTEKFWDEQRRYRRDSGERRGGKEMPAIDKGEFDDTPEDVRTNWA